MTIRVGQKAPDSEAPAYYKSTFAQVKLSDHPGKWILLCFYPGCIFDSHLWRELNAQAEDWQEPADFVQANHA